MRRTSNNKDLVYGSLGLIAALGVGTGEFLMHYNAGGYIGDTPYSYLNNITDSRLSWGHYLAVIFVPCYLYGYRHIYYILKKVNFKLATVFYQIVLYVFTIGAIWIGSRGMLAMVVQNGNVSAISFYQDHVETLINIVRIGLVIISILYGYMVWGGKTILPRWMAFCNPAIFLALVFAIFFVLPSVGNVIIPTALNVAHLLFFSLSMYFTIQHKKRKNG